ncbi:MAG: ETC complex I subunit [Caulobacteraceae bacterium]|nr:ETC complex I subunit [Caulobacteraceae bacterium]
MVARIYRPAKTAMQSGKAKTKDWRLDFEPESARLADPLIGWPQSKDMNGEISLSFETREDAIAYAQKLGIPFRVMEPKPVKRILKAYADNFAANRKQSWTH